MSKAQPAPTKREILDRLEPIEAALSSMMLRWEDDISPEVRAEIMTEAYEPLLRLLIDARRRPLPR